MSNLNDMQFHPDFGNYDKYHEVVNHLQSDPQFKGGKSDVELDLLRHNNMQELAKKKGYRSSDVKVGSDGSSFIEHRIGPWSARYTGYNQIAIHHDSVPDTPNLSPAGHHILSSMGYRTGAVGHAEVFPGVGNYVPNLEKADAKVQPHHVQSAFERFLNERSQ
jgi:hypothetical protein